MGGLPDCHLPFSISIDTTARALNAPGFVATTVNRNWLFSCNISFGMGPETTMLSELVSLGSNVNSELNSVTKYR